MTQRFRLALVNAAEDVPRVIRAYGRACGGEFALVLRPTESRGVLVHLGKDGAHAWRSADGRDAASLPECQGSQLRARLAWPLRKDDTHKSRSVTIFWGAC